MRFKGVSLVIYILGHCYLISDSTATIPKMKAVRPTVVARQGSNVTLQCRGRKVSSTDTEVQWKFNGQIIKEGTNKKATENYLVQNETRKGRFSLHITNVSEKDVGKYACKASVSDHEQANFDEDFIELSLYNKVLNVTTTQQHITVHEGSSITLRCKVNFTKADAIWTFWLFNGRLMEKKAHGSKTLSNAVKERSLRWTLKHVGLAQSGTYTCGANSTTIKVAQNISVSVHKVPGPKLDQSFSTVEITNGKNRTISCIAAYTEASYVDTFWLFNGSRKQTNEEHDTWFKRNEGFINRKKISLTIYNAGLNDSGQYSCVLNTSHGLALKNFSVRVVANGVDGVFPVVRPVHDKVLIREGSNATLTCLGRKVDPVDTMVSWKLNGKEVQENTNKKVTGVFLPRRRGKFSLHVTNVTEKDVGKYTCILYVANIGKPNVAEGTIDLTLYESEEWPRGTYAIPMPRSGCPVSTGFSWSEGLLRQDTEDSRPSNKWSNFFHLNGEKKDSTVSQHFCAKTNNTGKTQWPAGEYCIYKKGKCPYGFREGWIKWDDEDTKNNNFASGTLPDGTYNKDTVIYFCCRSDGSAETPIELPMRKPFFLLKHSSGCQAVLGMHVTEEWIFWDCEDRENKNSFDGEIPQSILAKDIRLYFCYYIKK